jgi:hypothetical protein
MKKGSILLNTARGMCVDESALVAALTSDHLAAAALDTFMQEPLPADSPLLKLGHKVLLSPHMASSNLDGGLRQGIIWANGRSWRPLRARCRKGSTTRRSSPAGKSASGDARHKVFSKQRIEKRIAFQVRVKAGSAGRGREAETGQGGHGPFFWLAPSLLIKGVSMKRKLLLVAFCLLLGCLFTANALAQDAAAFYKGKTLTVLIPSSPGGNFDLFARAVGPYLEKYTGPRR